MPYAIAKREMAFCAGPEHHTFYACAEHQPALEKGDVSCFLVLTQCAVEPVDEADEMECWFCQEG